ncbi:hypothetical protein SAMN05216267_1004219 [Actinacidiphila rubida]|uniref:Uncharacterized protein n=2 Tax=Actinacidiphila rubida TaxID=310780 RepID=A0A1H8G3N8_9ACTN|nr:hypothetical protein [Actinacidiphila rubida]SEN38117.1 hypothetical protein SAMN05216267_1004219 [Actinacidiphila rubida]
MGFVAATSTGIPSRAARNLEAAEWADVGIPLLANPRDVIKDLHTRHLPSPSTAVVAVYDPDGRVRASASFSGRVGVFDGWERRNALLSHLRRVIPHDLRLRHPVRTAVLMVCRDGVPAWTPEDGAWMWGLRDACTLHGLRCGSYVSLTGDGWNVIGENRAGRTPNSASWSRQTGGSRSLPEETPKPLPKAAAAR